MLHLGNLKIKKSEWNKIIYNPINHIKPHFYIFDIKINILLYILSHYFKLNACMYNEFVMFSFVDVTVFIYTGFNSSILHIRLDIHLYTYFVVSATTHPHTFGNIHLGLFLFLWKLNKLRLAQVKVRVELGAIGQYEDTGNILKHVSGKYRQIL